MSDKSICVCQLCSCHHLGICRIQLAVTNVFHDSCRKQMRILQNDSKRMSQIIFFNFVNINAIITDLSVLNIIKSVNQICNRRLSCTSRADKRNFLTRRCVQIHIMKHDFFRYIAKIYIIKNNISGQLCIRNRTFLLMRMLPCPKPGTRTSRRLCNLSIFFFCIYKRYISFVCFCLFI